MKLSFSLYKIGEGDVMTYEKQSTPVCVTVSSDNIYMHSKSMTVSSWLYWQSSYALVCP